MKFWSYRNQDKSWKQTMVPMEGNCCENIRMNVASESRNEANNKKNCHLGPKQVLKVEAWNVRTIYECSKSVQVVNEMRRYKLDILSISEMQMDKLWIRNIFNWSENYIL